MDIIINNPFRVLGIPANASARDLNANKSQMKLLDIGFLHGASIQSIQSQRQK